MRNALWMPFLHVLALDDTFWSIVAQVQAVIMVALVLEMRAMRDEYGRAMSNLGAVEPRPVMRRGAVPLMLRKPDENEREVIMIIMLLSLVVLGGGLVASLIALAPLPYLGQIPAVVGLMAVAGSTFAGIFSLVLATVWRLFGGNLRRRFLPKRFAPTDGAGE